MDFEDKLIVFGDFIKGTCELMCPESERKMRERERLVHAFERLEVSAVAEEERRTRNKVNKSSKILGNCLADPSKIVKAFSRSAAGHKMPSPSELRPFPVLVTTVSYLIEKIACDNIQSSGWVERYNFVTDRLRAVRQDMVIQNLPPAECIRLLEPMVKFHVFSGYWLCENSMNLFDGKMNNAFLQECIKRLLVMYDISRATDSSSVLRNCNADELKESTPSCNSSEHLMRALYLLINLGDPMALNYSTARIVNCENSCKSCLERKAYRVSVALYVGNYVRVCNLIRKLPLILCMAAALHLPSIRRYALMVMTTSYSNKSLKFPLQVLQDMLIWDQRQHVIEDCRYYGLAVDESQDSGSGITFQKGMFANSVKLACPLRLQWLDELITPSSLMDLLN